MKKLLLIAVFCFSFAQASIFSDGIKAFQAKEYDRAYNLFHRSLNNQSSIQANYFLGLMHLRGLGTPQNLDMAYKHLNVASSIGNARAKCLMAELFILKRDIVSAKEILQQPLLQSVIECQEVTRDYNKELKGSK